MHAIELVNILVEGSTALVRCLVWRLLDSRK